MLGFLARSMLECLGCARYLWEEHWMLLAKFLLRSLSLEFSLERFDSGFPLFSARIINEVLLARLLQASTIPVI
jgi:hypothetical protein